MANSASLRGAFSALLGTVQTTAQTFTSVVNTTARGVSMADKWISDAADKQHVDSIADRADYVKTVIARKSQEDADRQIASLEYCRKSPEHETAFNSAHAFFAELLEGTMPTAASAKRH